MSKTAMMPEYAEVLISDLFVPQNGSSTYTKEWCQEHQGDIPLFSGNTFGPFDHIDVADYDGEYITWAKDGLAGYTMYHNGKFSLTGHRGILIPKGDHSQLDVQYLRLMIEPIFRKNIKGRLGINGKNEYTTLNSVMINGITEKVKIPVTTDGAYDLAKQKELAQKHLDIKNKKAGLLEKVGKLAKAKIIIQDNRNIATLDVPLNDMITHANGKASYTKEWCEAHPGDVPVYSANNSGPIAYSDTADYTGRYLTYSKNGCAGHMTILSGQFSVNGDRCVIKLNAGYEDIDLLYLKYYLEPIFRANIKGRLGVDGKNEYTKINSTMIKKLNIVIPVPVKADGAFDLVYQQELAQKYATIETMKESIYNQIEALTNIVVI